MSLYIVDIHGELEGDYEIIKKYEEPFINKPCVSSEVCEHDKNKVLDKIRAEIEQKLDTHGTISLYNKAINDILQIIDKYKADRSEEE